MYFHSWKISKYLKYLRTFFFFFAFQKISTLPLLNVEEEPVMNDDEECAARQIVRHVTISLKKYMEAHLYWKAEQLQRAENARTERDTWQPSLPHYKVNISLYIFLARLTAEIYFIRFIFFAFKMLNFRALFLKFGFIIWKQIMCG